MTVLIKNLNKEFDELSDKVKKEADKDFRSRVLQAYADLKLSTPVDTGRARNSWNVSVRKGAFREGNGGIELGPAGTLMTLYISNGTPYIEKLNDGYSKQAPPLFIDAIIRRYFPFLRGKVVDVVKR